ncbi:MAG TPA: hypothetical protein PLJ19_01235 [Dysgonamonadaceae bacterium]|nr:hypothetical protein [Dysgonamonadaceae bacterium]
MTQQQLELEIENRIEADYKKIVEIFGSKYNLMTRPYISGTVINVTEDMVKKYGREFNMNYDMMLKIVDPIAFRLQRQYFN